MLCSVRRLVATTRASCVRLSALYTCQPRTPVSLSLCAEGEGDDEPVLKAPPAARIIYPDWFVIDFLGDDDADMTTDFAAPDGVCVCVRTSNIELCVRVCVYVCVCVRACVRVNYHHICLRACDWCVCT